MKLSKRAFLLSALTIVSFLPSKSNAQYYFGRNKIQYDAFEWQIMRTEHFDVYFYPEMEELAEIGASVAEEAYARLEGVTDNNITRRIPLIFYATHSHFQQTNTVGSFIPEGVGGFFEFLKGRVVIPSIGSVYDFKHVINHELVHVFTRSKMNRVFRDHRKGLFRGVPLWFVEGIAEYWSEGWSSRAEMIIRDAVLSNYVVPLSQMDRIFGSFLMYKEGQTICKYISDNFGEEKLLQLYENAWKADNFSEVMKLTIGLNYKEFDHKWLYDLKKQYWPLLEENDAPKMVTQMITKQGLNTKPAFFKKGQEEWVAFVANRVGYSNVYAKPLRGPDNKAKVLVKGGRTSDFESFYLLRSKIDANASGELTFISKSGARDALYTLDSASGKIIQKFDFKGLVSLTSPNWSPDGKQIVFAATNFGGRPDLYLVDLPTGELTRLTNDFFDDRDPAWSPDGKVIAFSSDRTYFGKNGFKNLFLYHLDSGQIQHLTDGKYNDYSPTWSPDGTRLAFTSDRDGAFNIWMIKNQSVNLDDAPLTEVVVASVANREPTETVNTGNKPESSTDDLSHENYPSALEPTDQLKKVTNFTTGAEDPEWVDNDRLLFAAFQDFGYQIQLLDGVEKKFEEAPLVANDTLTTRGEYWEASKVAGRVESTKLSYNKHFTLDVAQSAIAHDPIFGSTGGAQIAISDILGNNQYHFLVFNNSQTKGDFLKSWNVAVTKVDLSRRVNYATGLYRLNGRFYDRVDSFFQQDRFGGFVTASYPLSTFKRIEGSFNLMKEKRDYDTRGQTVDGIVVTNSLAFVKDNALWGITGPIDGERYNLSVGHTVDVQNNDVSFFTITGDYRHYFRLGRRTAYALRLMGRFNLGKEAFRYFMGGSWDLRLYPRLRIWGRKSFLINNELRFPFVDRLNLKFPFGGLGFSGIQGATFVDLGQAWDKDYQFNEILGSMGFGARMRFGLLVLRYEMGRRFQIRNFDSPSLHWDKGLRKSFWFGFDF